MQVKINSSDSAEGERSWMPLNSLSKRTENGDNLENATLPAASGKEQAIELNVTEQEHREPKKEELQRIMQLMDGFKASKVSGD